MDIRQEIEKEIEDYLYKKSYNCDGIIRVDEHRFNHIAEKLSHKILSIIEKDSGWVSVKDRLPEDYNGKSDEYLVLNYGEINLATWHAHSYNDGVGDSHDGKEFMVPNMDSDYGGMFVARGVTHWMPLPQPPKREEENV